MLDSNRIIRTALVAALLSIALFFLRTPPLQAANTYTATYADAYANITQSRDEIAVLKIPSAIPFNPAISPIVKVPLIFEPNGTEIVATGFSIRYDDTCLALIDSDVDENGVLDGVNVMVDSEFVTFFNYDNTDKAGQFDMIIADFGPPYASIPESQLLELTFRATCFPEANEKRLVGVGFGTSPAPSFSDANVASKEVQLLNGSVEISLSVGGTTILPPGDPGAPSTPMRPIVPIAGNQPPTAVEDLLTTREDTSIIIDATANDTDADGGALFVGAIIVEPTHGTAEITREGKIEYTPAANFSGEDSLVYFVLDGRGGSATGRIKISVNAVNDVPTFNNFPIVYNSVEGEPVLFFITAIDQESSADGLRYSAFGLPFGTEFNTQTGEITGTPIIGTAGSYDVIVFVTDGEAKGSQTFTWNVLTNSGVSPSGSGAPAIFLPFVVD